MDALKELLGSNNSISLDINVILSVLFFTLILSLYEFVIYRYISKRTVYNKELNISIITRRINAISEPLFQSYALKYAPIRLPII